MNSGFGQQSCQQQPLSPFGSTTAFCSPSSSSVFGSASRSSVFGSGFQGFPSGSTSNLGFSSAAGGFGESGFGSSSSGTPVFGSTSTGTLGFGSPNAGTLGFGSATTGTSGFGSATTGTSGFGSASTGMLGFGSARSGATGFGSANTGTSTFGSSTAGTSVFRSGSTGTTGFGSDSTATPIFGSGSSNAGTSGCGSTGNGASIFGSSTGTPGFGSSSTGTSVFGSASTGMSAFGSGGTGTGTSIFGTGTTGNSAFGSSGFGGTASVSLTGNKQQGFGTGGISSTSFGPGASVFGTSTAAGFGTGGSSFSILGANSSTSTSSTGFGAGGSNMPTFGTGSSVFGIGTTTSTGFGAGGSSGFGTASSTGFGSGGTTQSGFGTGSGTFTGFGQTGFGSGGSTQSGFGSGGSTQSGFGSGGGTRSGFGSGGGTQSGFGSGGVAQSGFGRGGTGQTGFGTAASSSTPFTAQSAAGFGGTSMFGAQASSTGGFSITSSSTVPQSTSAESSSVFTSVTSSFGGVFSTVSSGTSTGFGTLKNTTSMNLTTSSQFPASKGSMFTSTPTSFDVFSAPSKPASTSGGSTIPSFVSNENKGPIFPSAAAVSVTEKSVFGFSSSSAAPGSSAGTGSSSVFGAAQKASDGDSTKPVPQSSVFGGKSGLSSSTAPAFSWSGVAQAPVTSEPGGLFGAGKGCSTDSSLASKGGTGHGSDTLVSGVKKEEGAVFGKKVSDSAGSVVFGGKRDPRATFPFSVASGGTSNQKRGAESAPDKRDTVDSKRGKGEDATDQHPTQQGTPERQRIRRSSSLLENISNKTSIVCKHVPANLNKGTYLRAHFSKFGKVRSVRPMPAKMAAVIQFETHEAAEAAKKNGHHLSARNPPITIFYKSSKSDKSPTTPDDAKRLPAWSKPSTSQAKEEGFMRRNTSQRVLSLPSMVADELASMGGTDEQVTDLEYHILDRPGSSKGRPARESHSVRRTSPSRHHSPPPAPSTSSPTKPAKVDAASFAALRKTLCSTTSEKISILDARDKLLRQMREKHTGALQRKAFVGTCPDMCPEKERYYREDVRRLSIYEIIPGSSTQTGSTSLVDHSRAVKEYSRSSADQDEPLPHELRPLRVLMMTMNYLLAEIANRGEDGKWAEWYDFLWNRTRGIRKDITQQQLCSQEVVGLIEKCVRFHIYCSERLCMEDMMVFDSKINNENLTKCLQTLKEMYTDLENKHNILCPNEAEFRAYIVLMNLNEGDTLREVQQLRADVRNSHEIKFAVKAYSALNSNNYVRFFRLMWSASFLNVCVLHRYFNQMRARALQIMLRSHTTGSQQKILFPLSELVRLLAFENETHVREFCAYYGLMSEVSDLVLDRSMYVEPESSIPVWRAKGLVESKQMMSVGEVMNGGLLQPVQLPVPQNSFDERGHFTGTLEEFQEATGVGEMSRIQTAEVPQTTRPLARIPPLRTEASGMPAKGVSGSEAQPENQAASGASPGAPFSSEAVKMVARDLFWEVIDETAHDIAQSLSNVIQYYLSFDKIFTEEIVAEVSTQMIRETSTEVLDSERSLQLRQKEAERRERQDRLTEEELTAIVGSTVEEEVTKIVQTELRAARARNHAQRLERCTDAMCMALLGEVSGEMILQVAEEVHAVDVVARLQLLAELQKAVELRQTSMWFRMWRKAYAMRQRQKRAMLDFPCAPSMQRPSHILQSLCPDRPEMSVISPSKSSFLINRRARLTLLSPLEAERRSLTLTAHLSLVSLLNSLQRTRAWQPLRLASILNASLPACIQQWPETLLKDLGPLGIQWKLLLSLPGDMEVGDSDDDEDSADEGVDSVQKQGELLKTLSSWLCAKFTHEEASDQQKSQSELLSLYSVQLMPDPEGNADGKAGVRVSVCVRNVPEFAATKLKQPSAAHCQTVTKGTSAIMILLPHADTDDDTVWLAAKLRLARLLEAKLLAPPVPLALLLPCSTAMATTATSITNTTTTRMGVQQFQDKGLVSEVAVVELPTKPQLPAEMAITSPVLQTQVTEAMKWLASRLPEPPQLKGVRLGELVEDILTEHFFTPILQDQCVRKKRGKLHQAPNSMIGLYNSVLDHMAMALTSPALQDISWPAPEFLQAASDLDGVPPPNWNSKSHLADIYQLVSSLRLPWFRYQKQDASEWSQVCQDVWAFVHDISKSRGTSPVSLTTRISFLLAQARSEFENLCSLTQNEDYCTPTYVNAPWVDIILACVNFCLERLHNWKDEGENVVGGDLGVFYQQEDMEDFESPTAWLQALLDTEDSETCLVEETVHQAVALHVLQATDTQNNSTSDDSMSEATDDDTASEDSGDSRLPAPTHQPSAPASRVQLSGPMPDNVRAALSMSQGLLLHVEEERRKTRDLEQYLERALKGETLEDSLTDLSPVTVCSRTPHWPVQAPSSLQRGKGWLRTPCRSGNRAGTPQPFSQRLSSVHYKSSELLPQPSTSDTCREGVVDRETQDTWYGGHNPLSVSVEHMREDLQAQRQASDLFERRLQALLES